MPPLTRCQLWLCVDSLGLSKADVLAVAADQQIRIELNKRQNFTACMKVS